MSNFRSGGFRRGGRRPHPPQSPDAHRINQRITAREVRVIDAQGEQAGVLSLKDALALAEESGLDLVEVAPNSKPPVCKVMDYGKFKYRAQKKEAEARKKRTDNTVKELRIRYRTDSGDLETKLKRARTFLDDGDKVKFSMRFKGREIAYMDLGNEKFQSIIDDLADVASVDERSPLSGRQIYIVLAPLKAPVKKKPVKEKEATKPSKGEAGSEASA